MRRRLLALMTVALVVAPVQAQRRQVRDPLRLALGSLDRRGVEVAAIRTEGAAVERQRQVRATMLRLIGPLPARTPLNPVVLGETILPGMRIQKVLFDSQPGFHVTALLYLPEHGLEDRSLPAIVMTPGHQAEGKASDYAIAAAFARNGFAVLSYDPLGQGERLQYPDPKDPGYGNGARSLAGHATGEHGEASLQPVLIGESIAKYFVWDAMSAVDYLLTRPEVDGSRIGAFGCSGGGADTALLGALDGRIKAVGTACYLTTFATLLPALGPQDAEQSTPGWIAAGLDFADYVEAAAPRPYAIIATEQDMFPFAGAKATYAESQRFYDLFQAATGTPAGGLPQPTIGSPLAFISGPGGHGHLQPILPRIIKFFVDALQPAGFAPIYDDQSPVVTPDASAFQVTSTGQVSTFDPNAATVFSLNLEHARTLPMPHPTDPGTLERAIRKVTGSEVSPLKPYQARPAPAAEGQVFEEYESSAVGGVSAYAEEARGGVARFAVSLPRADGTRLQGLLIVPKDAANPALHLLLLGAGEEADAAVVGRIIAEKDVALLVSPEPAVVPARTDTKSELLGPWYLPGLALELVGRTILGERLDDVMLATNYLDNLRMAHQPGVRAQAFSGHLALVLLHAAVLDGRLTDLKLGGLPGSYAQLLANPLPRDAPEDILPGVLREYDVPDLLRAVAGRRVATGEQSAGNLQEPSPL